MKKYIKKFLVLATISIAATALFGCKKEIPTKKVGIILPIEHQALNEITQGFTATLTSLSKEKLDFKVMNAEGDINIQRAIIMQMRDAHYDLIVPLSTSASQMTASLVKEEPIVALAASIPESVRIPKETCNIAVVDDELDNNVILQLIHKTYPNITKVALIHSASDKILPEVDVVKADSPKYGISVRNFMVQNLADLYSVGSAIPDDTDAIFILKDNLVASGIATLIQIAHKKHILLITSDDATLKQGADLAIGVGEKEIGIEGAKLAAQILNGKSPCSLPIIKLTKPHIFKR
ncbi:MAG: ABC transporter substrate binding protein [Gammaproteobacteria bacterium]